MRKSQTLKNKNKFRLFFIKQFPLKDFDPKLLNELILINTIVVQFLIKLFE